MRKSTLTLLLAICFGVGALIAVPAVPVSDQAKIDDLVKMLGSDNFRQRDAANKELDAIGAPALEALRKAAKSSDMETANRATALIAKIQQRGEAARLIAPTYVELSFKETPIEEAVAELAKKSGYSVVLGGDKSKLNDRRVSLETGKVPFWKALDMLCAKAELVESEGAVSPVADDPRIQPVPPIQIRPLPAPIKPIQIQPIEKEVKPVDPKAVDPKPDAPKPPQGFSADDNAKEAERKKAEEAAKAAAEAEKKAEDAEAAKRAQAQPAVQPAQPVPVRPVVAQPLIRPPVRNPAANGNTIVLVDGKSADATHSESAVRVRALTHYPNNVPTAQGEIGLMLEVRAEPKIQLQQVLGIKIDKAIDNYDQLLEQSMIASADGTAPANVDPRLQLQRQIAIASTAPAYYGQASASIQIPARLKKGEKESKSIKELRGEVSLKIRTPIEEIVGVENILKAKGETVTGKNSATVKVIDIEKLDNGSVKTTVELRYGTDVQPGTTSGSHFGGVQFNGNIQLQGNIQIQFAPAPPNGAPAAVPVAPKVAAANPYGIELVDEKGGAIPFTQLQSSRVNYQQGVRTMTGTMTFRPNKDQEAARLVFKGTRLVTVDVPFLLKDVVVK